MNKQYSAELLKIAMTKVILYIKTQRNAYINENERRISIFNQGYVQALNDVLEKINNELMVMKNMPDDEK